MTETTSSATKPRMAKRTPRPPPEEDSPAGVAAAVCVRQGILPGDVPVRLIREEVRADEMLREILQNRPG